MKIKATISNKGFSPITLSLTMKSLDEVQVICALFNYAPTSNWVEVTLGEQACTSVRNSIRKVSGHSDLTLSKYINSLHHSIIDYSRER